MCTYIFDSNWQIIIPRENLGKAKIDIWHRDIVIAFNEPEIKKTKKSLIDSKLNFRLPTYFLPALEIARMQSIRPRLFIVSAITVALKWNTHTEKEQKILMINNNLKIDYLKEFFARFFPDDFSIIEFIFMQDPLKVSEDKLLWLWGILESNYPEEIKEITSVIARYKNINLDRWKEELKDSFKYGISHLFGTGDINFEWNYIHNPIWYLTIWWSQEKVFNKIRDLSLKIIKKYGREIFDKNLIIKDNLKLIVESKEKIPPAYTWYTKKTWDKLYLEEVTYENWKKSEFYDNHKKLKYDMKYIYDNLISREDYEFFWDNYKSRYLDLKSRYREAYMMSEDF